MDYEKILKELDTLKKQQEEHSRLLDETLRILEESKQKDKKNEKEN